MGKGGMQMQGGQGTANKARSKEAAAVLKGMRVRLSCRAGPGHAMLVPALAADLLNPICM